MISLPRWQREQRARLTHRGLGPVRYWCRVAVVLLLRRLLRARRRALRQDRVWLVVLLVVLVGCGGSSYRCACTEDGHVRAVELSNYSRGPEPPAVLPAKAGGDLCVTICQANEVPPP